MGYDTTFTGSIAVEPALTPEEAGFLRRFSRTRHCSHQPVIWTADGLMNCPPTAPGKRRSCFSVMPGCPSMWCQWEPNEDGTHIRWNGMEKFYNADEWLRFLIEEFLKPDANVFYATIPLINGVAATDARTVFPPSGHQLNGVIDAQGEELNDRWRLIVERNYISRYEANWNASGGDGGYHLVAGTVGAATPSPQNHDSDDDSEQYNGSEWDVFSTMLSGMFHQLGVIRHLEETGDDDIGTSIGEFFASVKELHDEARTMYEAIMRTTCVYCGREAQSDWNDEERHDDVVFFQCDEKTEAAHRFCRQRAVEDEAPKSD